MIVVTRVYLKPGEPTPRITCAYDTRAWLFTSPEGMLAPQIFRGPEVYTVDFEVSDQRALTRVVRQSMRVTETSHALIVIGERTSVVLSFSPLALEVAS